MKIQDILQLHDNNIYRKEALKHHFQEEKKNKTHFMFQGKAYYLFISKT